jgi:tRNA A-37 threonylcarbamoyl transferase component Bud32
MNLNSNSGDLVVKEGDRVVKTYLKDPSRAVACIAKLQKLSMISLCPFPSNIRVEGTATTFSMPFIEGKSGVELHNELEEDVATEAIDNLVSVLRSRSVDLPVCMDVFVCKLESIKTNLKHKHWSSWENQLLDEAIKVVKGATKIMEWPTGPSHGDLTLSNVIVAPNGCTWFIDTLVTPTESYLHDIAKLIQEYTYGWSYRAIDGGDSPMTTPMCIREAKQDYPIQTEVAALVCLARIVPYVKDEITEQWLMYALDRQISKTNRTIEEQNEEIVGV